MKLADYPIRTVLLASQREEQLRLAAETKRYKGFQLGRKLGSLAAAAKRKKHG